MKDKKALISVSDKTGIVLFAQELKSMGWEIISTGGTARALREAGLAVKDISEITGFPEILDGRLKTLHPLVHGGILGRRDLEEHVKQMKKHSIETIDLVAVNLYPFPEVVAKEGVTLEEAVENIDIGGPTMVRAAAKNYHDVIVVVEPSNYSVVIEELRKKGDLSPSIRYGLAVEAFSHTAYYDSIIANHLRSKVEDEQVQLFPPYLTLPFRKSQALRYGENPHQKAAFYREPLPDPVTIAGAQQLQGKEMSFNNINDLHAAWELVKEFQEPTAVAVKHANPCGVGSSDALFDAYQKAYDADPVSIFGGIVALNREVDEETAKRMSEIFLEVIAGPAFTPAALDILSKKQNVRLLTIPLLADRFVKRMDIKKVSGGLLLQEDSVERYCPETWRTATSRKPTEQEMKDLIFGLKTVRHVNSNAIVVAKREQTLGIGAGQMSRVGAVKIALTQAGQEARGSVMASDAFFPFKDGVELAAQSGITAVIQPGGSNRDEEVIEACEQYHIAMIFTGKRYFKH